MPELPEVETVVRDLKPQLEGETFNSYQILVPSIKVNPNILKNNKIINIYRRAKYIIFVLENGYLVFHLRMTGRMIVNSNLDLKHVSFVSRFKSGKTLVFKDIRKFGTINWYKNLDGLELKLGVEPLSEQFTFQFLEKITNKKQNIKSFLLDQKNIVGIGNIYADEILWESKIHPLRKTNELKESELKILFTATKEILNKAIEFNGTTFINFQYGEQKIGEYAKYLNVFTKVGKPCKRCKTEIIKTKVAQRGTYLCNNCQR